MKHYFTYAIAALLGSASAAASYNIPLEFNRTNGRLSTETTVHGSSTPLKLMVNTQFEYLAAYSTQCKMSQQSLKGGAGQHRQLQTDDGPCPGDNYIDVTLEIPESQTDQQSEIQWINPIQTYNMEGKFYSLNACPAASIANTCQAMNTLIIHEVKNTGESARFPYNGFMGLAPPNSEYSNNFVNQLMSSQTDKTFTIFIENKQEGTISNAKMEVGGYSLEEHAVEGFKAENLKFINDNDNDFYWSVQLNNVYLYDGDVRESILSNGPHNVMFTTQQKDISVTYDDFSAIQKNLQEHGVMLQTNKYFFRCTADFLKTLPDLELEFQDGQSDDLISMKLPWQGYVEVINDKEDLCQLRIRKDSFDWQIGTWARRQIYTIYRLVSDTKMQVALVDSIQKEASGRSNEARYVRIVIIFVVTLASLFVIFSVACCIRKYYQRNAKQEVTFATVDEQVALKNGLNASAEETIDQEDTKQ